MRYVLLGLILAPWFASASFAASHCGPGEQVVTTVHVRGSGELGGHQFCAPVQKKMPPKIHAPQLKVSPQYCTGQDKLVRDEHHAWCVHPYLLRDVQ